MNGRTAMLNNGIQELEDRARAMQAVLADLRTRAAAPAFNEEVVERTIDPVTGVRTETVAPGVVPVAGEPVGVVHQEAALPLLAEVEAALGQLLLALGRARGSAGPLV